MFSVVYCLKSAVWSGYRLWSKHNSFRYDFRRRKRRNYLNSTITTLESILYSLLLCTTSYTKEAVAQWITSRLLQLSHSYIYLVTRKFIIVLLRLVGSPPWSLNVECCNTSINYQRGCDVIFTLKAPPTALVDKSLW